MAILVPDTEEAREAYEPRVAAEAVRDKADKRASQANRWLARLGGFTSEERGDVISVRERLRRKALTHTGYSAAAGVATGIAFGWALLPIAVSAGAAGAAVWAGRRTLDKVAQTRDTELSAQEEQLDEAKKQFSADQEAARASAGRDTLNEFQALLTTQHEIITETQDAITALGKIYDPDDEYWKDIPQEDKDRAFKETLETFNELRSEGYVIAHGLHDRHDRGNVTGFENEAPPEYTHNETFADLFNPYSKELTKQNFNALQTKLENLNGVLEQRKDATKPDSPAMQKLKEWEEFLDASTDDETRDAKEAALEDWGRRRLKLQSSSTREQRATEAYKEAQKILGHPNNNTQGLAHLIAETREKNTTLEAELVNAGKPRALGTYELRGENLPGTTRENTDNLAEDAYQQDRLEDKRLHNRAGFRWMRNTTGFKTIGHISTGKGLEERSQELAAKLNSRRETLYNALDQKREEVQKELAFQEKLQTGQVAEWIKNHQTVAAAEAATKNLRQENNSFTELLEKVNADLNTFKDVPPSPDKTEEDTAKAPADTTAKQAEKQYQKLSLPEGFQIDTENMSERQERQAQQKRDALEALKAQIEAQQDTNGEKLNHKVGDAQRAKQAIAKARNAESLGPEEKPSYITEMEQKLTELGHKKTDVALMTEKDIGKIISHSNKRIKGVQSAAKKETKKGTGRTWRQRLFGQSEEDLTQKLGELNKEIDSLGGETTEVSTARVSRFQTGLENLVTRGEKKLRETHWERQERREFGRGAAARNPHSPSQTEPTSTPKPPPRTTDPNAGQPTFHRRRRSHRAV